MLIYDELKTNAKKLLSLTGLMPSELESLLPMFRKIYLKKYPLSKTMTGKIRRRKTGMSRKGSLRSIEQSCYLRRSIKKAIHFNRSWVNYLGLAKEEQMNGYMAFEIMTKFYFG